MLVNFWAKQVATEYNTAELDWPLYEYVLF